jgi:hypothetical protein
METLMETSENQELTVTLASLAPILKLDKLQLKAHSRFYNYANEKANPEVDPLPRYVVLRLLLADLLERLAFLTPSKRQTILEHYNEDIDTNQDQWETLAFADGNWCTWTGHHGWLDLTSGDVVETLPAAPVETIGYNLVTLHHRAIAKIRKRNANVEEHPPGSVDEP